MDIFNIGITEMSDGAAGQQTQKKCDSLGSAENHTSYQYLDPLIGQVLFTTVILLGINFSLGIPFTQNQ